MAKSKPARAGSSLFTVWRLFAAVSTSNITVPVTNKEYEDRIEDKKRNIFTLKPEYINVILDDLEGMMTYEKGGTQYVNPTLKRADNIRLFQ